MTEETAAGAAEGGAPDETAAGESDDAYGGVFGAFPYAFRASDSWLFRVYVVGGGLLALAVAVLFGLSLVVLIGETVGVGGGTFSFSRAFVVVLMLLVVMPLLAPILAVARRHRRTESTAGYDRALALTGYAFVLAMYVGLVISLPAELRDPTSNPLVAALYDLPGFVGFLPPAAAVALMLLVHRAYD